MKSAFFERHMTVTGRPRHALFGGSADATACECTGLHRRNCPRLGAHIERTARANALGFSGLAQPSPLSLNPTHHSELLT
jgi:hypothetical protein